MLEATRRAFLGLVALFVLPLRASTVQPSNETRVLDGWAVVMTRLERLAAIIKTSYLHRDYDKELMKRVRLNIDEIEEYLNRIEANIKW